MCAGICAFGCCKDLSCCRHSVNMPANDLSGQRRQLDRTREISRRGRGGDCMYVRPNTPDLLDLEISVASGLQVRSKASASGNGLANSATAQQRRSLRHLGHGGGQQLLDETAIPGSRDRCMTAVFDRHPGMAKTRVLQCWYPLRTLIVFTIVVDLSHPSRRAPRFQLRTDLL